MSVKTYPELEQGSPEWLEARAGIVTASVVGQLITAKRPPAIGFECPECGVEAEEPCVSLSRKGGVPIKTMHPTRKAPDDAPDVLEVATTETAEKLTAHLAAERITGRVEETFTSRDMERGQLDEPYARDAYVEHYAPVTELGFMVREEDDWGFKIGCSPDGLVAEDGAIEIKSRLQKIQLLTILSGEVPTENMAQCQTVLLVSGRDWLDYVSYRGGMPLYPIRVEPDPRWQEAIVAAVRVCEENIAKMIAVYEAAVEGLPQTEYIDHFPALEFA